MTDQPDAGTLWRAALEQLPPDLRGFRRTLRLHALAFQATRPAPRAACGYEPRPGELRPDRSWDTVTPSGRCTLCELRLRRAADAGVSLPDAVDVADPPDGRPRLTVVADDAAARPDAESQLDPERRSPERP